MALTIRRERGSTRLDALLFVATTKKAEACRSLDTFCPTEMELEFSTLLLLTDYRPPFPLFNFALSSRSCFFFSLSLSFFFSSMKFRFLRIGMTRTSLFQLFERTGLRLRSLIFFLYHTDKFQIER